MQYALLTRSIESSPLIVRKLLALNYSILEQPLIEFIDYTEALGNAYNLYKTYDLIITSKQAAHLVAKRWRAPANCYVVGKASADILQAKGFRIKHIAINVDELDKKLCSINNKKLLYLRGSYITRSFSQKIKEVVVYKTNYVKTFNAEIIAAIIRNQVKLILIFSYKSAETFINLIQKCEFESLLKEVTIICLSQKIAAPLSQFFPNIYYPTEPTIEQFIDVLF